MADMITTVRLADGPKDPVGFALAALTAICPFLPFVKILIGSAELIDTGWGKLVLALAVALAAAFYLGLPRRPVAIAAGLLVLVLAINYWGIFDDLSEMQAMFGKRRQGPGLADFAGIGFYLTPAAAMAVLLWSLLRMRGRPAA